MMIFVMVLVALALDWLVHPGYDACQQGYCELMRGWVLVESQCSLMRHLREVIAEVAVQTRLAFQAHQC